MTVVRSPRFAPRARRTSLAIAASGLALLLGIRVCWITLKSPGKAGLKRDRVLQVGAAKTASCPPDIV